MHGLLNVEALFEAYLMRVGDFVKLDDQRYIAFGVGKIEDHEEGIVTVSFFDSPVDALVRVQVPISTVRPVNLSRQTRVYWFDVGKNVWRVGRAIDHDESEIDVRFPNKKDRFLPVPEVFVRWDIPLVDPTGYLAKKINETPIFSDARSKYVKAMMGQRRATLGMPALFSSIIDLELHQVEVIRRVLQDPVQRYLLADEVGLGKTIEAGVLIRQYVLDDPAGHQVVVIVPPALVNQWRDELRRRFLLDVELDHTVKVVAYDNHEEIRECLAGAGMVVVDEAHHINRGHWLFELLATTTSRISRFLLLSATPVLGNETGFLELLHLLDPLVFPLEELETFRSKIVNRQELAGAVAGLVPENLLQLEDYIDTLMEMFAGDSELERLTINLRVILDRLPEEYDPEFLAALSELRAHVGETYRLDRRILRNRRKGVPGLTPNRDGVIFYDFASPAMPKFIESLEEWRRNVSLSLHGKESSENAIMASEWFFDVLCSLAARKSPQVIASSIILPRLAKASEDESISLQEIIEQLSMLDTGNEPVQLISEIVTQAKPDTKFIVFCSDIEVADRVQKTLASLLTLKIDRYEENSSEDYSESVFSNFQNNPEHRVLVCDQRAEEGLNLQGGNKILIHFDLPLAPNRIEQRIGRVDRYGTGSSIQSIAIRCSTNPFEYAWGECLDQGLEVFDRSIASLQYLIDDEMRSLKINLLFDGLDAITEIQERLGGPDGDISLELHRIDDQDSLDALIVPSEENYDELFDEDDAWRDFQNAVDTWLVDVLHMKKTKGSNTGDLTSVDGVIRYMFSHQGGSETLIPLDRFLDNFISVLDRKAPGASFRRPLSYPYTCRRQTSLTRKARDQNVRLLRYGDTFLSGLTDITTHDDRGRSVAVWRQRNYYKTDSIADLYFRFDFLVEANTDRAATTYASASGADKETAITALKRRGDMTFPPSYHQVWLDEELNPVTNEAILEVLQEPYLKGKSEDGVSDLNLNWERWDKLKMLEIPAMDYWSEIVHSARAKAESILGHQIDLEEKINSSLAVATKVDLSRFAQLQTRIQQADQNNKIYEKELLTIEKETVEHFYDGIRNPKITLDLIGATFVSGQSLDYLAMISERKQTTLVKQ